MYRDIYFNTMESSDYAQKPLSELTPKNNSPTDDRDSFDDDNNVVLITASGSTAKCSSNEDTSPPTITHHPQRPECSVLDQFSPTVIQSFEQTLHQLFTLQNPNEVNFAILELIHVEQQYIDNLRVGITNYVIQFDQRSHKLPPKLRGQKYHIFRNIERILAFHEQHFYPALRACEFDVQRIADTMQSFFAGNDCYLYVQYAMHSKRALNVFTKNGDYFRQRQLELGDKLGVCSWMLQPIQRLPRYRLLLERIINGLIKVAANNDESSRLPIKACYEALFALDRMLVQVNTSLSLNDLVVDDNEFQFTNLGYFRRGHKVDVVGPPNSVRNTSSFHGMLFVFDQGIVVSAVLGKQHLQFKQFIDIRLLSVACINETRLDLFDRTKLMCGCTITANSKTIAELRQTLIESCSTHPATNEEVRAYQNTLPRPSALIKMKSIEKDKGFSQPGSRWYPQCDENLLSSNGPVQKRLLNGERNYQQMLDHLERLYSISTTISGQDPPKILTTQLHRVEQIRLFHRALYHELVQCGQDISPIFDAYSKWISNTNHLNQEYMANCPVALEVLCTLNAFETEAVDDIREHLHFPFTHVERQCQYLRRLNMEHIKPKKSVVQKCDEIESRLNKCASQIKENFMANLLERPALYDRFGLVLYADSVTMQDGAYRMLLLATGLVCVRISGNASTFRTGLVFAMPLSELTLHDRLKLLSLKFWTVQGRRVLCKVFFVSNAKRNEMSRRFKQAKNSIIDV